LHLIQQFEVDTLGRTTKYTSPGGTVSYVVYKDTDHEVRAEITDAVRAIAEKVSRGELRPEEVSECTISDHLYTAGWPDPDLLIRTAGELRVSNFLLWQISYAELHVTPACWPDFGVEELHVALRAYASRTRKYGGLVDAADPEELQPSERGPARPALRPK